MSENTKIEWTDATFNPWIGCTKVSPACDHCYAEVSTPARTLGVIWGAKESRHRTSPANWKLPLRWNAQHAEFFAAHGRRRRVFCASLADVFDNQVDPAWRRDLFDLIELTPNLNWLLLTKRIGSVFRLVSDIRSHDWLASQDNVWLGATICNQEEADRDIPKLLATPASVRFLSMEPLLGPVNLSAIDIDGHSEVYPLKATRCCEDADGNAAPDLPALDWVIAGGESGASARPMHPDWARSLRDQCASAGVPFLFKQWGEWAPGITTPAGEPGRFALSWAADSWHGDRWHILESAPRQFTTFGTTGRMTYVGKKSAGRRLDGVQHDGYPEIQR
ncbi:phage Gp37/Gp68 family protein [Cupriavidus basilensis]|uniref:phage Gp37/Gp68 family protein n=1 Tax=Cupriavidus basilensis TaxID=68895 RepID=UPI00284C553D|nr:phage Gp37/Gp68 family protein [Cupriavidus basilensis]MDR3382278.1 phage Gp37/Gp68 family protein [Cupriavidus basilensis]